MTENPSFFKRLFFGFFKLINISRKVIINLVFFTLLLLFFVALSDDSAQIEVPDNAVLILNLKGNVVEQKTHIDPMDAAFSQAFDQEQENPEVLLQDIVDVIEHARTNDKIQLIVLKLQGMKRAGITKLAVIAEAINAFKASGKEVIAIGDAYSQDQYYLASHANEIWLNPKGWLVLDGYGRYQLYYKSALEKLEISQHIFRVGTYKSAVEPYIRNDMSNEAKEANKLWLTDLWNQYKETVSEQRGFAVSNFDENATTLVSKLTKADGNVATYALDNKWVDQLMTHHQVDNALKEKLNSGDKEYAKIGFNDYLYTIQPDFPMNVSINDQVAVIVAKGTILDGNQKAGTIGGVSTAALIRKARKNDRVKAVVLRVDSPGGSAYASDIIRQEIDLLKQAGKPVVASMGTYAASGGYWISAPADKIIAAPSTITGSIGIFGMFMTFEKSLAKLGIYTDGVGTTDLSGFGVTRPLSEPLAAIIQMNVERGYRDFLDLVAKNRAMSVEQVDSIAQGRVWSGKKAMELGLVDELGDLSKAISVAAELAGLTQYDELLIEKELSPKDKLIKDMFGQVQESISIDSLVAQDPLSTIMAKIKGELTRLNQLNDPQGLYLLCEQCEID